MSITADTFLAKFPEFSGIQSDSVSDGLSLSELMLNKGKLGKFYERLCYLRTAHYLSLRFDVSAEIDNQRMNSQENNGVITTQSANTGGLYVSTSLSALVTGENAIHGDFARTNYGLEYLSILRQVLSPVVLCS